MKAIKLISIGAAAVLLAGCATSFKPWKLSDVEKGMNQTQVEKILGAPDYTETKDGAVHCFYTYREEAAPADSASMQDSNEAIDQRVDALTRTIKVQKYEVVMVDGKVTEAKEVTE